MLSLADEVEPCVSIWEPYYGYTPQLPAFLGLPSHLCGSLKVRKFFRDPQEKEENFFKLVNTHKIKTGDR